VGSNPTPSVAMKLSIEEGYSRVLTHSEYVVRALESAEMKLSLRRMFDVRAA